MLAEKAKIDAPKKPNTIKETNVTEDLKDDRKVLILNSSYPEFDLEKSLKRWDAQDKLRRSPH